jgi:hypothetical protein
MTSNFPEAFHALDPFSDWAIPTTIGRVKKRVESPLHEAQAFYSAVSPRLEEILAYLDQYELGSLAPQDANLLNLTLSLAEIATCVEFYDSMSVPKGVEHNRFPLVEPTDIW